MRARLARRLVVPLAAAVAALFLILGFVALRVADASVRDEFELRVDRATATLEEQAIPPEHRRTILEAMRDLSGLEFSLGETSTLGVAFLEGGPTSPTIEVNERSYRWWRRELERTGETLFVYADEAELERRRRDALSPIAIAGAVGLLIALAVGLWVARLVAQPVRELADSVQGFARGEFQGSFRARGPGEIGELQDAFVAMTDEIERSQQKLRESERLAALGRVAGGIAHELRNPLTAIRMAVETACDGEPEQRAEAREVAVGEIERLDRTLRELLHYVRPRPLRRGPIDLPELLGEVGVLLTPQCRHLSVELEIDAEPGCIHADRDRVKQALLNLVLNGAQAQLHGGRIVLRSRGHAVEVEDAGPGISEDVRETLWQPFVSTKAAGIGLGLAVVDQVAREHEAELTFRTGSEGTTFRMEFPNAPEE